MPFSICFLFKTTSSIRSLNVIGATPGGPRQTFFEDPLKRHQFSKHRLANPYRQGCRGINIKKRTIVPTNLTDFSQWLRHSRGCIALTSYNQLRRCLLRRHPRSDPAKTPCPIPSQWFLPLRRSAQRSQPGDAQSGRR